MSSRNKFSSESNGKKSHEDSVDNSGGGYSIPPKRKVKVDIEFLGTLT